MKKILATFILATSSMVSAQSHVDSIAEINILSAPVKSAESLSVIESRSSPLDYLSDEGKATFIDSLSFNDYGVTSFNYRVLENELTYSQIREVLSLIGFQHLTSMIDGAEIKSDLDRLLADQPIFDSEDHKDYECESRGTCSSSQTKICTSTCYH